MPRGKPKRHMSVRARRAISARMKERWAERKARKAGRSVGANSEPVGIADAQQEAWFQKGFTAGRQQAEADFRSRLDANHVAERETAYYNRGFRAGVEMVADLLDKM